MIRTPRHQNAFACRRCQTAGCSQIVGPVGNFLEGFDRPINAKGYSGRIGAPAMVLARKRAEPQRLATSTSGTVTLGSVWETDCGKVNGRIGPDVSMNV